MEWVAGLRCPGCGGQDQGGLLRGLEVWLVRWLCHGWVTLGFMITVWEQKCSKIEHFRAKTVILAANVR